MTSRTLVVDAHFTIDGAHTCDRLDLHTRIDTVVLDRLPGASVRTTAAGHGTPFSCHIDFSVRPGLELARLNNAIEDLRTRLAALTARDGLGLGPVHVSIR